MLAKLRCIVPEAVRGLGSGAAGKLPFRLGRQPIAIGSSVPIDDGLRVAAFRRLVDAIAGRQALPLGQAVAEPHGVEPTHVLHRAAGSALPILRRSLEVAWVFAHHLGVLPLRHRVLRHRKCAQPHGMLELIVESFLLTLWTPHPELAAG